MKHLQTYDKFKNWFNGSKVVNPDGSPRIVYHGTGKNFRRFSMKKAAVAGITWFTTDKEKIEKGEVGAASKGFIKKMYISLKNPAGWDEYQKYGLGELYEMGFDGAILPNDEGNYDGFVFHTDQIRIIK